MGINSTLTGQGRVVSLSIPGRINKAVSVTPSDSVNFSAEAEGLYVGTTGDITAVVGGVAVLFQSVPSGFFPVPCTRVNATGTTAEGINALYSS